jgi:hypothetical protein
MSEKRRGFWGRLACALELHDFKPTAPWILSCTRCPRQTDARM